MRFALDDIFAAGCVVIGMVHLMPLPGAPGWSGSMDAVLERAVADAKALQSAGFDGVLVENYSDVPFYPERVPAETAAAMAVAVREAVRAVSLPLGVNVLRNDGETALAIAHAAGARFVRINVHTGLMAADQGLISGRAHETLRLRARLGAEVAIFADMWVKHAAPFPGCSLEQAAEDCFRRGLADALIVTGTGTGKATDLAQVDAIRASVPEAPVLVGSGVTIETVAPAMRAADGIIVGSAVCRNGMAGAGVDPERAKHLIGALQTHG